jgi:phosphoglycolate phosphatase-like HAD superfamily hydrolase
VKSAIAIAFGLDGTLVQLPVDWGSVRRRLGELFSPLGYRGLFDPLLDGIDAATVQVAKAPEHKVALAQRARSIIDEEEARASRSARPFGTARTTVQGLNRRGYPLGIVTSTGRAGLRHVLAAAGLADIPWRVANTRDDVSRSKPDPEGLIGAARALTPHGGVLWFVGSRVSDVHAGQRANRAMPGVEVRTVAVVAGRLGLAAELRGARPDHLIDRIEELVPLVLGNW